MGRRQVSGGDTIERPISKAEYEAIAAFRYSLRKFLHFSENAAEAANLTAQQHQALLAIQGFPGRDYVTVGELAERLRIRHHSAVGLVDRLAAQNLVSRQIAPVDRRQVHLTLTAHGKGVLEKLTTVHREELHRMRPVLENMLQSLSPIEPGEESAP